MCASVCMNVFGQCSAVWLDVDLKLRARKVKKLLGSMLEKIFASQTGQIKPHEQEMETLLSSSLSRLLITPIETSVELVATLYSMDSVLETHADVGLVVIDSISGLYWIDQSRSGDSRHVNSRNISQLLSGSS
eukprot:m.142681 g.142681  ORF g.142681 m.142681 type:complete len:133 (+) comp14884_c1_seq4:330-728(+)